MQLELLTQARTLAATPGKASRSARHPPQLAHYQVLLVFWFYLLSTFQTHPLLSIPITTALEHFGAIYLRIPVDLPAFISLSAPEGSMQIDHKISLLHVPHWLPKAYKTELILNKALKSLPHLAAVSLFTTSCIKLPIKSTLALLLRLCALPPAWNSLSNLLHLICFHLSQHRSSDSSEWLKISPLGSQSHLCICLYYHLSSFIESFCSWKISHISLWTLQIHKLGPYPPWSTILTFLPLVLALTKSLVN